MLAGGCGPAGASAPDEEREHVRAQMQAHHTDALAMRDAVVAGDLPAVREAAARLRSRLPLEDLPPGTATPERAFVDALLVVQAARDPGEAGRAVGRVVGTCAGCHSRVGVRVAPPVPPAAPPPADGSLSSAMAAHRIAADRLWVGLVAPDPAELVAGAELLSTAVLTPSGLPATSPLPPAPTELEVRVHDLASSIARSDDPVARADAYGRMLEACWSCHALTGGGPKPVSPGPAPR